MILQYLGTAAAESVPAMFRECSVCKASFEGSNIRTRSQAVIDGRLLIDFPPDNGLATYDQMVKEAEKYGFLVSYDGMSIEI